MKRRFTKRLSGPRGGAVPWTGVEMQLSCIGWAFAQSCRLFGAPCRSIPSRVVALVSVSEDSRSGGQCWTRIYSRPGQFPQVIHSAKRFAGPTGSTNILGAGSAWRFARRR